MLGVPCEPVLAGRGSASECGEERESVKGDVRQMGVGKGLRGGGGEEAVHEVREVGWREG